MILNGETVQIVRANATRLARAIRTKDDLIELAASNSFEEVLGAIEVLLTNTDMFFDDELLLALDEGSWKEFKAVLLVYALNIVNRMGTMGRELGRSEVRDFGASAQA